MDAELKHKIYKYIDKNGIPKTQESSPVQNPKIKVCLLI